MDAALPGEMRMSRLEDVPDENLVEMIIRGDESSFAEIAARYRPSAIRVAYGILHNRVDAEDAVQEAFIRIYRYIGRYEGAGQFRSWVYRVVVNECLRTVKSRGNRPDETTLDEGLQQAKPDTDQVIMVRQCLATLPGKYRMVLALRGVQELDYAEIADILCIPVGTVRSRLHEARRLFAAKWKEMVDHEV